MSELITNPQVELMTEDFCRQCGTGIAPLDNFCGQCGVQCRARMDIGNAGTTRIVANGHVEGNSVVATGDSGQTIKAILNNRLAVIGIIALIGPVGLPALWFSPRFGSTTKVITTLVYILMTTVVPLAIAWYFFEVSLRPLADAF